MLNQKLKTRIFFFQLKVLLLSTGQDDPGIQLKLEKKIGPVCEKVLDTL